MDSSRPPTVDCHVRLGVDLIRHSWDAVVLTGLRDGPARRGELLARIGGASDKVLHEALRRLRDHRLVEQTEDCRYSLSEVGSSFAHGPLLELARWAQEHHQLIGTTGPAGPPPVTSPATSVVEEDGCG